MSPSPLNPEPYSQDLNRRVYGTGSNLAMGETPAFQALCQAIIRRVCHLMMRNPS